MKLRRWYGLALNLVLAFLTISGAAFYVRHIRGSILEIRDADSGRIYGSWPLGPPGEFSIEFVHSVNQSPVRETFTAEKKMILPKEARFYSFGAGMQSDLEEGQILSRDGDSLVITGFRNSFKELNYIVGTVSDHLLFVKDKTVSLRELCGRNSSIIIRIR